MIVSMAKSVFIVGNFKLTRSLGFARYKLLPKGVPHTRVCTALDPADRVSRVDDRPASTAVVILSTVTRPVSTLTSTSATWRE
jgi:hypothetical protein